MLPVLVCVADDVIDGVWVGVIVLEGVSDGVTLGVADSVLVAETDGVTVEDTVPLEVREIVEEVLLVGVGLCEGVPERVRLEEGV